MDGPDAVVHFLEPDDMLLERIGQEEQPRLESNRPCVGHALRQEVPGILERWDPSGVWARRRPIDRGWGAPVEKLMGPVLVVDVLKAIEGPLLTGQVVLG